MILPITLHLGRVFTRKIVLCYMQYKNRSKSTSCEKDFQGCQLFGCFRDGSLLDKSCCDRLFTAKVFLEHNISIFIHMIFIQLFLSLRTLNWFKKRFSHHSKIKLCTTNEFFLIESIKIIDDLNNENQYLCLQLNCLNQIKCHKNHFLYLKFMLLLSGV